MEARMKAATAAKTNTGRRKEKRQKQEERRQDQTHRHEKQNKESKVQGIKLLTVVRGYQKSM